MISKEMKQMEHYRMYAEVFGIDVPLTQSKPTESTQGMHRTPSAPRSTHLTPPAPIPTVDKADDLILQDTLHVSLAEHKSRQEQEARENMALVEEHLASVEIEKMVEGQKNVVDDELKRREKEKNVEESRITPFTTLIRSPRIHTDLVSSDTKKLQELTVTISSSSSPNTKFMPRKSFVTLADHLHEAMADSLPTMVDKHIKEQVPEQVRNQVPVYVTEGLILERQKNKEEMQKMIAKAILQERNQEQVDDYDFWNDSYALDDDEIPIKQVSQDIMEEVSLNIDEAKLKKIADEMLRQRCTSGDEHQYHIDQMKNFLKSNIRDPEAPALSLINQDLLYLKKGNSGTDKIVLLLHKFPAVVFNDDDIED
nr:hypothetical protein [Tanacetum cinerariifolium]